MFDRRLWLLLVACALPTPALAAGAAPQSAPVAQPGSESGKTSMSAQTVTGPLRELMDLQTQLAIARRRADVAKAAVPVASPVPVATGGIGVTASNQPHAAISVSSRGIHPVAAGPTVQGHPRLPPPPPPPSPVPLVEAVMEIGHKLVAVLRYPDGDRWTAHVGADRDGLTVVSISLAGVQARRSRHLSTLAWAAPLPAEQSARLASGGDFHD